MIVLDNNAAVAVSVHDFKVRKGNLGVPAGLRINWFDPADNDLYGLSRQRVKLLRQLEDLIGFHLLLLSHVNEASNYAEKQPAASVGHREELHPDRKQTGVDLQWWTRSPRVWGWNHRHPTVVFRFDLSDLWKTSSSCTAYSPPSSSFLAPSFFSA